MRGPHGIALESRPPARRSRRGFSMVEILAVVAVFGLIATLVAINWRAILPKAELHKAVRLIGSTLQSTRSEAIARKGLYRVQYDLDRHRYRVETPLDANGRFARRDEDRVSLSWVDLPDTVRFKRIEIDGVEYKAGMVFVRLDALGSASGHVIQLVQNPYEAYYTIEVQGLTGLIDYHEGLFVRDQPKDADFR
jgi:prepilin-type N-terminal cleavage/methylation domain-containing protein